jgi:gluconate kinase
MHFGHFLGTNLVKSEFKSLQKFHQNNTRIAIKMPDLSNEA